MTSFRKTENVSQNSRKMAKSTQGDAQEKTKALKEMLKKDIKDVKITCGENEAKLLLGRCQRHQESPS